MNIGIFLIIIKFLNKKKKKKNIYIMRLLMIHYLIYL